MVSGFPHAGRISTTSCGVIVHRQAWIHRSGRRFGSAIAFSLYWSRFFSAGSSQCSSSHRSYSAGGHAPASRGAHGHRLMTQWYWSKFRPSSTHRRVKSCSTSPHPRRRRWPAGVRPTMRACTSRNARTTSRCQATVGTNTGRSCVRTPNGPRARRRPSRTVRRGRRAGRG